MSSPGELTALKAVLARLAGEDRPDVPDAALLERFHASNDQAAFAVLVRRHGGMVLGVCRRVLRNPSDAEDASQATFLVLARRAAAVRRHPCVPGWLHEAARRTAGALRRQIARRRVHEHAAAGLADDPAPPDADPSWREVGALLDDELARLPDRHRLPLVLCYLQGLTRDEAARQLGWELDVFRGRLERGRDRLRSRLQRRGLTLSAGLAAGLLTDGPAMVAGPADSLAAAGW